VRGEAYTGFWWGNLRGKDHVGDPGVDGMIILRWISQEVGCEVMDYIELDQDRDRWRDLMNAVMNLRVPQHAGNYLTSLKPVSFSRRTLLHVVSR
jgi:CRISPR/Cas system-associated protein Cas7 (RAMP superfamily)